MENIEAVEHLWVRKVPIEDAKILMKGKVSEDEVTKTYDNLDCKYQHWLKCNVEKWKAINP